MLSRCQPIRQNVEVLVNYKEGYKGVNLEAKPEPFQVWNRGKKKRDNNIIEKISIDKKTYENGQGINTKW